MEIEYINAPDAHDLESKYSQAVAVNGAQQTVYVSGQIPVRKDGTVPDAFKEQAELAWHNVEAQLRQAGMGLGDVIRHTTYLADRKYKLENSEVRRQIFNEHQPALTVIIAGIFDEAWLLEIEAVAAR